jgi:hypothetical protein
MMNGTPSFADPANLEPKTDEAIELEPTGTSLNLLQAIYRNAAIPLTTRIRAAIAALQFEHPKLAVTANVEAGDFAFKLDQAVERSRRVMKDISPMIEAKPLIDANVSDNVPDNKPYPATNGHKPSVPDRRYRRW